MLININIIQIYICWVKQIKYILTTLIFLSGILNAQSFIPNVAHYNDYDIFKITSELNSFYNSMDIIEKGKGYKQFKRWEWFWQQRSYPSGKLPDINHYYLNNNKTKTTPDKPLSNSWSFIGPSESPGGFAGLGRVNVIKVQPNNENILWAGAASGGLWKYTNAGNTWTTNTDNFSSLGISDIVIQPNNPNIIYILTGDADAASTFSIGVLKSTDNGVNWNSTGLKFNTSEMIRLYKMIMHPTNFNTLYVAGNNGVFKTTNAGANWSKILDGSYFDIEFKPGEPNTIYVAGTDVKISTNAGSSWEDFSTGFPKTGITRVAIAVTPIAPNNIYAVVSNQNFGFGGFFVSTNSGINWLNRSNSPNLLGWSPTGNDQGGQGWYDLCIAVSPIDPNIIYVGGINIWKSEDGGFSWKLETNWYATTNVSTVHADHHDLWFIPNTNTLFSANDGGVYIKRSNQDWQWLGSGLEITQFYRLGCSVHDENVIIAGSQDNGTKLRTSTGFLDIRGGDGMESIVDYSDPEILYAVMQFGTITISSNGGKNFFNIKPIGSRGHWITPVEIHPTQPNILFAAFQNIYKTTNRGDAWTLISDFDIPENQTLTFMKIAESNPDIIYTGQSIGIFKKTTNGGITWTDVNKPEDLWLTAIAIHPHNPNIICIAFSGYIAGKKIYLSYDGGNTWNNISGSLPNVPFNTIIFEHFSPDRIYAGSDIGVYYLDKTINDWIPYSDGLPNVIISELEIHYPTNKLRAATYGRGLWEVNTVPNTINSKIFGNTTVCTEDIVTYSTISYYGIKNIWSVSGGTLLADSLSDTVHIRWQSSGNGTINLRQTNTYSNASDSTFLHITIREKPKPTILGDNEVCRNSITVFSTTDQTSFKKWTVTGGQIISNLSDTSASISVKWTALDSAKVKLLLTNSKGYCSDSSEINIKIKRYDLPVLSGDSITCLNNDYTYSVAGADNFNIKWMPVGGKLIEENGSSATIQWTSSGTALIKLALIHQSTQCKDTVEFAVIVNPLPEIKVTGDFNVCSNSPINYSTVQSSEYKYQWTAINGYILGADSLSNVSIVWLPNEEHKLNLSITNLISNCTNDSSFSVNVQQNPRPKISGDNQLCLNSESEYAANQYTGFELRWDVSGGLIIGSNSDSTVTIKWLDNGTSIIKLTQKDLATSCIDSTHFKVNVTSPTNRNIIGLDRVPPNYIQMYFINSNPQIATLWEITGGTILSDNDKDSILVKWGNDELGNIKLTLTSKADNCSTIIQKKISIEPNATKVISGNSMPCLSKTYTYSTNSSDTLKNLWIVTNGQIIGSYTDFAVNIKFTQKGEGLIKLLQTNINTNITDTINYNIYINDIPIKPVITRQDNLLISNYTSGNQWYYMDSKIAGMTDQMIVPFADGKYNVMTIDSNNCDSPLSDDFYYSFSTIDFNNADEYIIFPNPTVNSIDIIIPESNTNKINIRITDLLGRDCEHQVNNISPNRINVSFNCNPGNYFLVIKDINSVIYKKLIITR